jgi:fatty-acyl-CoA synthase
MIDSLKDHLESVECFICLQKPGWPFMEDHETLISEGEKSEPGLKILDQDVMSIFFTAGTTGRPKGAMRTHRHLMTNFITGVIELKVSYDEGSHVLSHVSCRW